MFRKDVIAKIKTVEPLLRARGVGALFLFGSHGRDRAQAISDIDVFVDVEREDFYDLSNFMGVYATLSDTFPGTKIDFGTRDGLSTLVRPHVEAEAIQVF